MKKVVFITFALVFCMTAFQVTQELLTETAYLYVGYVDAQGFFADLDGVGRTYICYPCADEEIKICDTVAVRYFKQDVVAEHGSVTMITGYDSYYEHVLNKVISLRPADPKKGEPVFG